MGGVGHYANKGSSSQGVKSFLICHVVGTSLIIVQEGIAIKRVAFKEPKGDKEDLCVIF